MADAQNDELTAEHSDDSYRAMGHAMDFLPLGKAVSEEALEEFRVNPMTLEERLWEKLEWERPENETCSCWWISNYNEPDKSQPCRLICRSLTGLRLET